MRGIVIFQSAGILCAFREDSEFGNHPYRGLQEVNIQLYASLLMNRDESLGNPLDVDYSRRVSLKGRSGNSS